MEAGDTSTELSEVEAGFGKKSVTDASETTRSTEATCMHNRQTVAPNCSKPDGFICEFSEKIALKQPCTVLILLFLPLFHRLNLFHLQKRPSGMMIQIVLSQVHLLEEFEEVQHASAGLQPLGAGDVNRADNSWILHHSGNGSYARQIRSSLLEVMSKYCR
ncbi:unnamed protein product [Protopolystoma xenopodis]|uniref:Uncharacterized protein n=1 Tax=Protopolystoma xenopodis TaxID=117903 RepID=A0A448WT40_9PLAT|nr:unnamed protein product [Protopolystoma xenopodis]